MHQDNERLDICKEIQEQFKKHIEESIPVRDRLMKLEIRVDNIEKNVLRNAILGGIIGALIGSGASPAITHIVEVILKIK